MGLSLQRLKPNIENPREREWRGNRWLALPVVNDGPEPLRGKARERAWKERAIRE